MRYFSPAPILRPYVQRYALSESALESEYPVYPSTGIVMGFQYGGRIDIVRGGRTDSLEPAGITGIQTGARKFRGMKDTSTLLVYFTPTGAFAVFGPAVADMADGSYGLRAVQARAGWDELPELLADAADDTARIAVVEEALLGML